MNKEQQIKEMANITYDKIKNTCGAKLKDIYEALYNAGYRKIDDDCAVITKSELKQYKVQAVKEFAEKLWDKTKDNGIDYKIGLRALGEEIDELLKEYER